MLKKYSREYFFAYINPQKNYWEINPNSNFLNYLTISDTTPAPTVRPPSRIEN